MAGSGAERKRPARRVGKQAALAAAPPLDAEPVRPTVGNVRLVLDTDVMRSGLQSPTGASRLLLLAALAGVFVPLVSVAIVLEYEDVLLRAESLAATGFTPQETYEFLDGFLARAAIVDIHWRLRPTIRDAYDEMFVEALVNGGGEAVVSFNRRDYLDADARLASQGRMAIAVLAPGEALGRLGWRPTETGPFAFLRR